MSCDSDHHCITCSDEGVEMQIVAIDDDRGLALCSDESGDRHSVEIDLVAPVEPGETVLVHAAVALARVPA